ncbi:MAG: hypothetical protein AAB787_02880 [Patescibacteria group bacterium]
MNDDLQVKLKNIKVIPEEERRLEMLGDYGYRWRVRESGVEATLDSVGSEVKDRSRFTEYFFDFDDTLFDTKAYVDSIFLELEKLGIPIEEAKAIYNKLKIYRPEDFVQSLKDAYPDTKDLIESALKVSNPYDFVKPDMSLLIKELSVKDSARVHILTRGDCDYQLEKIKSVFMALGAPIDVLITEKSKAEFLKNYLPKEYPYINDRDLVRSFLVIDDKPEEIEQLSKLRQTIPFLSIVRLRDPSGKYSGNETSGEKSLEYTQEELKDILTP